MLKLKYSKVFLVTLWQTNRGYMKYILILFLSIVAIISCNNTKTVLNNDKYQTKKTVSDTVRIANDSLEYEVIIIDTGFSTWLASKSKPRGFYSVSYLENKNLFWVSEWNSRVNQPQLYSSDLYEMQINYDRNIHYGYEVNYLIFNYLVYFQITNNQKLGGFVPYP